MSATSTQQQQPPHSRLNRGHPPLGRTTFIDDFIEEDTTTRTQSSTFDISASSSSQSTSLHNQQPHSSFIPPSSSSVRRHPRKATPTMKIHHQTVALLLVLLSSLSSTSFATSNVAMKQQGNKQQAALNYQNDRHGGPFTFKDQHKTTPVQVPSQPFQPFELSTKSVHTPTIKFESAAKTVKWGMLLTTMAGFCNGAFMSGFLKLLPKQGVAAVTGAWTNSAIGLASENMKLFVGQSSILMSFIMGSLIYGLLNPHPTPNQLERKSTSTALTMIGGLLMGAIWILDHAHNNDRAAAFEVCCLAAVASGIQNSLTSCVTQNLCRTTHYTGISSDIGTFLGQVLRGNKTNLFKLQTFVKLAACFWMGGFGAFFMTRRYGADAILLPATMSLAMAFYTRFVHAC